MKTNPYALPALFSLFLFAFVAAGCDTGDPGDADGGQVYTAELDTLNSSVAGNVSGTATFTISADSSMFTAATNVEGLADSTLHAQHIHVADACPAPEADTNGDGFIDVVEGVPSYGAILVPLDGDLSSQSAGADGFPTANEDGAVDYEQSTMLADMLADLRAEDPDTTDAIAKLGADEDLSLEGRHVVIHGVADTTSLPATVQTIGNLSPHTSLPVACGTITSSN